MIPPCCLWPDIVPPLLVQKHFRCYRYCAMWTHTNWVSFREKKETFSSLLSVDQKIYESPSLFCSGMYIRVRGRCIEGQWARRRKQEQEEPGQERINIFEGCMKTKGYKARVSFSLWEYIEIDMILARGPQYGKRYAIARTPKSYSVHYVSSNEMSLSGRYYVACVQLA